MPTQRVVGSIPTHRKMVAQLGEQPIKNSLPRPLPGYTI
jgi:hypothetical protein